MRCSERKAAHKIKKNVFLGEKNPSEKAASAMEKAGGGVRSARVPPQCNGHRDSEKTTKTNDNKITTTRTRGPTELHISLAFARMASSINVCTQQRCTLHVKGCAVRVVVVEGELGLARGNSLSAAVRCDGLILGASEVASVAASGQHIGAPGTATGQR